MVEARVPIGDWLAALSDVATAIADTDRVLLVTSAGAAYALTGALLKSTVNNDAPVAKTIATGNIDIADDEHSVILTGQGDTTDALNTIGKTGGGDLDAGHVVTLCGKAGLGYSITITKGTYLHLQGDFTINNQYDTITLESRGSGHWQERSRANNS